MSEPRKGRQTPTKSIILPYTETRGQEAIEIYNSSGRTAQQWQELLIYDIMAVNEDGLWVHTKFGEEIPRRNGKRWWSSGSCGGFSMASGSCTPPTAQPPPPPLPAVWWPV